MSSEHPGSGSLREQLRRRKEGHRTVSCEPCRERKVRCDRGHPCLTCTKRQYPDLCHYQKAPRPRHSDSRRLSHIAQDAAPLSPTSTLQARESSPLTQESFSVGRIKPVYTPASLTTAGSAVEAELPNSNGIIALTRGPSSTLPVDGSDHRTAFGLGILPLLGSHDASIAPNYSQADKKVLEFLASEQHVLELFESYRHHVDPFCSLPVDLDLLENKLCDILSLKEDLITENTTVWSHIPRWFCLLSAVLASGAQASNFGPEKRHSLSKHYSQLAFDALYATEYLSQPYKEAIQSLILLGNVLQNEMQPHAAWCLASTTIRLAQCLGVHSTHGVSGTVSLADQDVASLRLALVWQDVLLSLVFGRPPTTSEIDFPEDLKELTLGACTQRLAYREAMNWICHLAIWYLSSDQHKDSMSQPQQTLAYIDSLNLSVVSYLADRQSCKSILEIQQHLAFQLHSNFVISTICRPYVSEKHVANISAIERSYILGRLRTALTKSASAYLQLRSIGSFVNRSWAFIHNGLSSILLLSLMSEVRNSEEIRTLQSQIIHSLEQDSALGIVSDSPHINRLSNTYRKAIDALKALRQLSEQEEASGSTSALTDDGIGQPETTPECRLNTATGLTHEQSVDGISGNNSFTSFYFDLPTLGVFDSIMSEFSTEITSSHF